MLDNSELRIVMLQLLAAQPRHGYELMRAIDALTGGAYAPSPGVLYPTLTLLVEMGFLREVGADTQRRSFELTDEGKAELEKNAELAKALNARLVGLASLREHTETGPVRRAMQGLKTALMERLAPGVDREKVLAVAAIVDEATQKIERLP